MNLLKISCLAAVLLFANSSVNAQASLKRANKQYELGTFNLAAQSYKDYLAKNPDNAEANAKIGDCYRHLNQQDKALPHYQAAVASSDVQDIYIFQYGLTLQELGRYDLAKAVFNSLGEKSPEFKVRCKQFSDACTFAAAATDPPSYKVTNEYANTASFDFGPTFFGDQVVYSSGRSDIRGRDSRNSPTSSGAEGTNRLFITQRDKNGFLDVPISLHSGFGVGVNEGPVAYSTDGKLVAFTRNNFIDGTRMMPSSGMELNLFIAQAKSDGDWETPLAFPHNGVGFSTGYPCFSPDGKALYFSSDRPGGYGGFDIYVSYRVGNNWSAPENVGNAVNTIGNEITPFNDGSTLFFASDYQKGFGGFDVFRAEASNGRWATVYHGGAALNTSTDDYGYVFDSARNIGYLVSNRPGGKGSEDIYRLVKESESVVIKVTDALTGAAVAGATIDFSDCGVPTQYTNVNGLFTFSLTDNLDCTAAVSKEGFSGKNVKITTLGLRQSRTVEVALTNDANSYNGKVVNGTNNKPIEDAKIIATNTENNEETTTRTDASGTFSIAMKPKTKYQIRYSKQGFKDLTADFLATTSNQKNLEVTTIYPVGTSTSGSSVSKEINSKETPPSSFENPITSPSADLVDGFAVQLAAGTAANPNLKPYQEKLGDVGNVFTVNEGGMTKVRLGVFSSNESAASAQASARAAGYTGAFIVPQKGKAANSNPAQKSTPAPKNVETKPTPVEAKPATTVASNEMDGYLVKIAAYRDLNNFKQSSIEDVGLVHFVKKGDFTIVLLGGYDSKSSAQVGLEKAQKRGFPGALLVTMDGGDLKRVN
ncbi:MAG: carboxypeptidase regulatory-like domain-containing protein [Saprospiraceae bacterium]|nr:carboxypeptidase regulatory-like domain-containing protein [Saprospiraceae bacterium]MCF8248619.1 carboxypeptidase regulatory-like domain-containing protein [Saprospiraceae bacterium]MCF8282975.1 carboxypeptidase regulatory-like domain-containing protein [Bacteroidales bacterium]MCF8310352.1 carboxypeptidase regulatory-like domain-containing protein [Saprospiraceae bacterium]MCF8442067.1 carboxypeptidase regulatory-like domain-containing protein [Saprospiraceae bacterium]